MKIKYCYKCKQDQPFLEDHELLELSQAVTQVKESGIDYFAELEALKKGNQHALSRLGPDCLDCSKPLRTPRAKFCAECGWKKQ